MPARRESYGTRVFLNVPFDPRYKKLFEALIFAVHDCAYVARCARERDDGSQVRIDKLDEIIGACKYGIHDLSRTTLDSANRLPRFNMPLVLGIFLGAKRYGGARQRGKVALILERDQYRYQKFCSDISGQDVRAHGNETLQAIAAVRDWLSSTPDAPKGIPGGDEMARRYYRFGVALPAMCRRRRWKHRSLPFLDYRTMVTGWLDENR
jgi:hypothetical protein